MSELARALVVCGLLSGTQPITLMGLLIALGGETPRRNGAAFVAGAFLVETLLVVGAALVLGGGDEAPVDAGSGPGRIMLGVRLVIGLALVGVGIRLRFPPRSPQTDEPAALTRLRTLGPGGCFVGGLVLADYQGAVIASLAMATAAVGPGGRLAAIAGYTVLATGIPLTVLAAATSSPRAHERLAGGTDWVLAHRRMLGSWVTLILGSLVAVDALAVIVLQ